MLRLIVIAVLPLLSTSGCATLPEPIVPLEEPTLPKAAGECPNDPCIRWMESPNGRYGEIDPECYEREKAKKRTFPTLPQS